MVINESFKVALPSDSDDSRSRREMNCAAKKLQSGENMQTSTAISHSIEEDSGSEPMERQWTRKEYLQLAEQGYFDGQRVQLIEGKIYKMPPQRLPHTLAVELIENALRVAFPLGFRFRIQMPFHAFDGSEPEPDVAIVPGSPRDSVASHPTDASLIVEVSDTTLRLDRIKANVYAASGIKDFWIVNLVEGIVEVHREPSAATAASPSAFGFVRTFRRGESLSPLAAPAALIAISDLLP